MTEREQMYLDYKRELCAMDGLDGLRAPAEDYLLDVRAATKRPDAVEWVPIIKDDREVGFLIITKGELAKRGEDYRIEEAYVKPEYRERGLMSEAVKKYLKEHPGKYSMQLMANNHNAAMFWFKLIGKRFYGDIVANAPDGGEVESFDLLFDNTNKEE